MNSYDITLTDTIVYQLTISEEDEQTALIEAGRRIEEKKYISTGVRTRRHVTINKKETEDRP